MGIGFLKASLLAISAVLIGACTGSSSPGGEGASAVAPSQTEGDLLETGLQGQVPLRDQRSGRSLEGYRRGMRLVGQNTILDRGSNFGLAWVDDCAYVTTASAGQIFGPSSSPFVNPALNELNGMAVIDASDPANPVLVDIVQSPAMIAPHESLQSNEARRIIIATRAGGTAFDIWQAGEDCTQVQRRGSVDIGVGISVDALPPLPGIGDSIDFGTVFRGHAMCLADDGMTAYATSATSTNAVIDLSDLDQPRVLALFAPAGHDCGLNPDGTRLYLAQFGFFTLDTGLPNFPAVGQNGLGIYDVSAFQNRNQAPPLLLDLSPAPPLVGFLGWTNILEGEAPTAGSHTARWFRNNGRTYVYSSDEWPTAGVCPWAHGRIIDITDEANPVEVSDITLEVNQAVNCLQTEPDVANYSSHYVTVDNPQDAKLAFISWYSSGLRVWDISDPTNPFEIAYWMPPPNTDAPTSFLGNFALSAGSRWDAIGIIPRYRPESGHIWVTGVSSGFQILELTDTAGPLPEAGVSSGP